MEFTARQIADFIKGRIVGDENATVHTFDKIEEGVPGAISFLSSPKYAHYLASTEATIVLVDAAIAIEKAVKPTLIIAESASISPSAKIGKDAYVGPFAVVGDGAVIGDNAQIYPNVYIGDGVKIGDNVKLYPNVVIYYGCRLGNNVTIHAGSVIGADGFGFAPTANGYDKIPQIGIVTIEDDVEIGANTCVDRSTMGSTIIHKGVKLDNLVQIAHNVEVGANTVMSAQVGIAGSTKVGQWCMFGGQVGIAGHITIGDKVFLGAQSGVPSSLKSNQQLIGTPPMEKLPYFKSQAIFQKLPAIYKQMYQMQQEIEELKKKIK